MTAPSRFASPAEALEFHLADARLAVLAAVKRAVDRGWMASETLASPDDIAERRHDHRAALVARLATARAAGGEPPLDAALTRLGLNETERAAVWLLIATELDPGLRVVARKLSPDAVTELPLEVLRHVVYVDEARERANHELGPDGKLWTCGILVDVGAPGAHGWRRQVRIAERFVTLAEGALRFDSALGALARFRLDAVSLDQVITDEATRAGVVAAVRDRRACVIATGPAGVGRRTLLAAAARTVGRGVIEVDAARLGTGPQLGEDLRRLARECTILDALPLLRLDALAADPATQRPDRRADALAAFAHFDGPILITASPGAAAGAGLATDRTPIFLELSRPTATARLALWQAELPETPPDLVATAASFALTVGMIRTAARSARGSSAAGADPDAAIRDGVRAALDDRFGGLAERIAWPQSWDDLVLPDEEMAQLAELIARLRHRRTVYESWGFAGKVAKGLGVAALFSGPPGTGKTMVAGLVAAELGIELYRVDLSRVVSKWIGETEKNLATLFDAAETGAAILLFDEADALFGKRTEVSSATDRYANLEVNYLLQRLESFEGIALLTTNHDTQIDAAFRRRLAMHVRFPMPEHAERARLWRVMMPAAAAIAGDHDPDALGAQFHLTGGHIRNAVLRAAFFAADEKCEIAQRHLWLAAQLELESLGRVAPRSAP